MHFNKHVTTIREWDVVFNVATFLLLFQNSWVNMGKHFGNLAYVRHIITYSLSPFEQRAFPNYLSKGIPNMWRRFTSSFFRIAPREFFFTLNQRFTFTDDPHYSFNIEAFCPISFFPYILSNLSQGFCHFKLFFLFYSIKTGGNDFDIQVTQGDNKSPPSLLLLYQIV